MEDCKIGKEFNPKTCRYVVNCKEGFIRNDQFRCRKENSKPRVAKPKNKNKTNKMGEEVFNPNFTKKIKGKTKTAKTKPNSPNVNEESYNDDSVMRNLEDSPPVRYTPKKLITKKVNMKSSNPTATPTARISKANITKSTATFIKGLYKKGYKISKPTAKVNATPKAKPTAKVNATPKAKPTAKVNSTPKAKEYNGIIRVKRTGQIYKGVRHTNSDGLGPFLIAGDLSILDHYRRMQHIQPSVNGSDYDKDAKIYLESLNPVTKNLFEKAVKKTPKYDVLKHSNKAGWLALLSHLNLYRYNPYKLGLLGLFPLTKLINDDPLPSMGIENQMPIISSCDTLLPGEKGYGIKPNLPYDLPSAKASTNDNSEIKLNVKRMKKDAIADILGTTQNMYDSTVFTFYSKSKNSKPGVGKGEYINEEETEKYKQLDEIHNWRQKLSNFHIEPFELNGKQWQSVEHYYQGSKFRKQNPDFYNEFSLDSDSEISKDPAMAKSAGGKEGKYKGKLIRSRNIKIDDDFFVNGRDNMEMIKAQYSKFTQNPDLTYLLYLTKNAKLVHYVRGQDPVSFYNLMYIRSLITDN